MLRTMQKSYTVYVMKGNSENFPLKWARANKMTRFALETKTFEKYFASGKE